MLIGLPLDITTQWIMGVQQIWLLNLVEAYWNIKEPSIGFSCFINLSAILQTFLSTINSKYTTTVHAVHLLLTLDNLEQNWTATNAHSYQRLLFHGIPCR